MIRVPAAVVAGAVAGLRASDSTTGRDRVVVAQMGFSARQLRPRGPGRVGRLGRRVPGPVEVRPEVVEGIVGPVRTAVPHSQNQTTTTTCDSVITLRVVPRLLARVPLAGIRESSARAASESAPSRRRGTARTGTPPTRGRSPCPDRPFRVKNVPHTANRQNHRRQRDRHQHEAAAIPRASNTVPQPAAARRCTRTASLVGHATRTARFFDPQFGQPRWGLVDS